MKKLYISVLLALVFFQLSANIIAPPAPYTVAGVRLIINTPLPQLGSATYFALFTPAGAVGNTGITNVAGNVGTNSGAITGYATSVITGSTSTANTLTAQCTADLMTGYNQIMAIPITAAHGAIYGNGETLYPGVYALGAAGSAAGTLTMDAQGDPNAVFIMQIGGAFTTGAGTNVVLANGALASRIFWIVEGAAAMAASTTMKGTVIAHNGAISMAAGGNLEGRMFSTTGAVATDGSTIYLPLSNNFNWVGNFSTNWNTPSNWLNNSLPTNTDHVLIGTTQIFNYFPGIPAAGSTVNINSMMFGSLGGLAPGLIINSGIVLNVAKTITYQSDAGSVSGYIATISGNGTLNTDSIVIAANTTLPGHSYTQVLVSSITNLNVTKQFLLTSTVQGADIFNATFNLTNGNALLSGFIQTANAGGNTSSFLVSPASNSTLRPANAAALSGLSASGTNVITFNNPGTTIDYSGAAQTVYTNTAITGLANGVNYQNIKFSGTGIKTAGSGSININGDFTNVLTNDALNNIDLVNSAVNFTGNTQNLIAGAGNGTVFNNVLFSGPGSKNMISGKFYVNCTGVLTISGTSSATILNTGGLLTLMSDVSGTASVAAIPTGPTVAGNVNVQRFFNAQASGSTADNTRSYRYLSSAVNNGSGNYALSYLNSNIGGITGVYVAGPSGTGGGFTVTNTSPTIYLNNESVTANTASFSGGNYKGLTDISGNTLTYYTSGGTTTATTNLPAGNGFLLFYVGNNLNNLTSTTALNKQFRVGGSYIAPDAAVSTATGILNQGSIPVKLWWNGSTTLSNAQTGYNLVGNPYASTIDWDQSSATNTSAGIYAPQVSATMYVYNYLSKNFGSYQAGTPGGLGTNNASRYIASGQAFFVKAMSATRASVTFNETAKNPTQLNVFGSPGLKVNAFAPLVTSQLLRIKLSKDSVNTDEIILLFNAASKNSYEAEHDAIRLSGLANVATLASFASGSKTMLGINWLNNIDSITRIKLYVNITNSTGIDTLSATGFKSLDQRFDIYLIDHFKKDSVLFNQHPKYLFTIDNTDAASYGANRFEIVCHKKSSLIYKLLSFSAVKIKTGVLVAWKTSNEANQTGFSIERKTGSKQFSSINASQSNGSGVYSYIDTAPLAGLNMYRLQQNDTYNTISFSSVVGVENKEPTVTSDILTLYPNPASSQFSIVINKNAPAKIVLTITNFLGQPVLSKETEGNNIHQDISTLAPGYYLVQITDPVTLKLIGTKKLIIK